MDHSLPYAVNCSILFTELPLLERPAAAAEAGFRAVEYWWPFAQSIPADHEVEAFVSAIDDAGVRLIGLNFSAGDMPGGDRGLVSWPGREAEFRDNVDVAVGIGKRLGVPAFNALYGNRLPNSAAEEQDNLADENLAYAAQAAEQIGAVVLLEAVSGAPRYPLLTAADVNAVIDRAKTASLRALCDLYHLSVNGDDLDAVIAADAGRIGHVQIADAPGRHEPGTGELDLDRHLLALQAGGFHGWVGLEYVPSTTTASSFDWVTPERRGAPPPAAPSPAAPSATAGAAADAKETR